MTQSVAFHAHPRRPRDRIARQVVGREHKHDTLLAAIAAGKDLVLEGPPGTSKTTMLEPITAEWDIPWRLWKATRN
jgi:MoxR-like ATPase